MDNNQYTWSFTPWTSPISLGNTFMGASDQSSTGSVGSRSFEGNIWEYKPQNQNPPPERNNENFDLKKLMDKYRMKPAVVPEFSQPQPNEVGWGTQKYGNMEKFIPRQQQPQKVQCQNVKPEMVVFAPSKSRERKNGTKEEAAEFAKRYGFEERPKVGLSYRLRKGKYRKEF